MIYVLQLIVLFRLLVLASSSISLAVVSKERVGKAPIQQNRINYNISSPPKQANESNY